MQKMRLQPGLCHRPHWGAHMLLGWEDPIPVGTFGSSTLVLLALGSAFPYTSYATGSKGQRARSHNYKNIMVAWLLVKCAAVDVSSCYWHGTAHRITA